VTVAVAASGWAAAVALLLLATARQARRRELVARAVHELRGPLSVLGLAVELGVRRGGLSPARLRAMELEVGRASRALADLDAAPRGRVLSGREEHVDVGVLVAESVEVWRAAAGERPIELELGKGPAAFGPPAFRGDRVRLAQAVGNLLANAIEHGEGRIRVRVLEASGSVRIEVGDEGPGLTFPLDALRRRGHGLRVASAVAEAHGGRLAATPVESGARLVLELPLPASGRAGASRPATGP
jgi:signal transduction histidine kinase